ncbi:conserved hypothetical protein [Perkinsus marinus ATCC 50983]|uniref:Nuclease S1 n=1 Tax=Perkinsus marinus (strain ATCC 50983 / TXsc) TaxID=423536 RepID=C5LU76_PERM5|nr:conserved hypothetical protein [Perkinsus marinus ATCC 50983]EEQ99609.1 conserved hypothetical protein [Perkinsus marinus ATCC 50983]|eukprot:XP_002766892.1 conserved hypothetical protein [Perkinsus marinus ATCC 50983]
MSPRLGTFLLKALVLLGYAHAWGEDGHSIVAAIAQRIVSDRVIEGVNETLGRGQDMIGVACWADKASHSAQYRWTAPLHFVDTPTKQCQMVYERDCRGDFCVIGAIYNYTNRAISKSVSRAEREFAMKLVIHFLGDIHQPLHVGFGGDRGRKDSELIVMRIFFTIRDEFELRVQRRREHRKIPPHPPYRHKFEERWHELFEHLWTKLSKGGEYAKHREEWLAPCRQNGLQECTKTMAEESLAVACTAAWVSITHLVFQWRR